MKNISRQFGGWVTALRNKTFLLARLKLAAIYTLATLLILIAFNFLVFELFVRDLPEAMETLVSEQTEDILENVLIMADIIILIFVALLSYFMSGIALKPVEKSYKQQKKFVADAAHELRTPLAVMKTGAETFLRDKNNQESTKIVTDFLEETNYLSTMVDDLLLLAKSNNLQKLKFSKVDLSNLAKGVTDHMQAHARQKDINLISDIEDNCVIGGSSIYLKRLLINLIQNAIDYNKEKGKVEISLKKKDEQVELKIVDNGIGISDQDLDKIFDRFYKVDKGRSQQAGGAGLGLSIVKEIVDIHQAKIYISSRLGKGTTVRVLFYS